MHLRRCRGVASAALTRTRSHNVAALQHAVRSFHISARRNDESSGSSNEPAPGNSARARSQAAGARIQSLPRDASQKVVGLAGGSFPSGQGRIITPSRNNDSASGPRILTPRTPRIQTRVTGRPGGLPNRFQAAGGARRPGGFRGPAGRRQDRQRRQRGAQNKDDNESNAGSGQLSDTMLRYLLELKAKRRAVKTYTPRDTTKEELVSQSALSASLGQPGGAPALLDARLRALADRAELDTPIPIFAQARRLVRGQFVKFTSDAEREAVMALVADEQARIAQKLSVKKGEEIAPKPIEFAELDGAAKKATTDAVVGGAYNVRARAVEPSTEEPSSTSRDVASRMLDLNGSYVGADAEKFLGKLDAILGLMPASQEQQ
ncbi:hypothetical protein DBV05_g11689 [Lasiodiplodia theobromae]|uniref:Uncharacterized protein n=1 Tax=Lasiodiplodia theobromae TaxID=45133 RepID=A0A5N5CW99_9PEZI|nr:hypothetical protein DBV05_g11689 [Lasiodiplodia theobromae]